MCVRCHLLGDNLGQGTPVLPWMFSVHFRADSGCVDCHGGNKYFLPGLSRGHAGLPDAAGSIQQCGKCHALEMSLFISRPPGDPGKFNCTVTCISCHGYHRVEEAESGLINPVACGRCHEFDPVQPHKKALEATQAKIDLIEGRVGRIKEMGFPVASLNMELADVKSDFVDLFHGKRSGQFKKETAGIMESLEDIEALIDKVSPVKWYFSGAMVVGFLLVVVVLLIGYQSAADASGAGREMIFKNQSVKEDSNMTEKKGLKPHEPKTKGSSNEAHGSGADYHSRPRSRWSNKLALIIALIALALVIQEKLSNTKGAVRSVNQAVTRTLMPQLKKANERATINSVYEMKRMMVTLDEIKETSANPEIKTRIDQIKMDLDELAIKLLVYE